MRTGKDRAGKVMFRAGPTWGPAGACVMTYSLPYLSHLVQREGYPEAGMERRGQGLGKSTLEGPSPPTFHCGRQHRGAERAGTQALGLSPDC